MQARDEGLKVSAVVHSSDRRLIDVVELTELGYRVRRSARWLTAIFTPISPLFVWSVYRELTALDPDEIRIHMPNPSAFWLFVLPPAYRKQWTLLWHSDVLPSKHSVGLRLLYWFYRPLEILLLKRANLIIATSPPYLASSKPLARFKAKCIVQPLRLDPQMIPASAVSMPQPRKEPGEGIRVLCVGRLSYYKGFDTAIRAIAAIPDAQLKIVGEGEMRKALEKLARELGLMERVEFVGNAADPDLWRLYTWCDVHCLPSIERTEAFGLSVNEAAIFNKPSIVSDLAGSGLVWNAQNTDVLFATSPPGNAEELTNAIRQLASNDS